MAIEPQRIRDAQSLLARHFGPTRIARAASLSSPGQNVFLKLETDLPTGSFKVRGAIYSLSVKLAAEGEPVREVVCASTGNHGAAVAYAAQQLGIAATIFLPDNPNPVKAARILALGARLVKAGLDLSAAIDTAQQYAEREGAFFLHDASDPDVPVGTATIGAEIVDQLPEADAIYVPMGDTALIRGVASAAKQRKPSIRIVGVVAERAPAYLLSWRASRAIDQSSLLEPSRPAATVAESSVVLPLTPAAESLVVQAFRPAETNDHVIETATCDTIADGLAIRRPLAPNVAAIRELVDEVVAVSEQEMLDAIAWLRDRERVIAEPAGAAAAAAFLRGSNQAPQHLHRFDPPSTTVLLVTGCNIAPGLL